MGRLRDILAPPSSGPRRGWYPNPHGRGFRYWDGRGWGEVREGLSDEERGRVLDEAIQKWARLGYKVQYRHGFDAQIVKGLGGRHKVFLSVNEVGEVRKS